MKQLREDSNRAGSIADVSFIELLIVHDFFWQCSGELTLNKASKEINSLDVQSLPCKFGFYFLSVQALTLLKFALQSCIVTVLETFVSPSLRLNSF